MTRPRRKTLQTRTVVISLALVVEVAENNITDHYAFRLLSLAPLLMAVLMLRDGLDRAIQLRTTIEALSVSLAVTLIVLVVGCGWRARAAG